MILKKKQYFFQLGVIISLGLVLLAFEWKTTDAGGVKLIMGKAGIIEEEMVEITVQKKKQPEMPKPLLIKKIVVETDELKIDEEDLIIDAENNADALNDPEYRGYDEPDREAAEAQPFIVVEQMPSFPCGEAELFRFLGKAMKYPEMARDANIHGTVYVEFVIDPKGSVTNVQVIRGIGGGCDDEAIRVICIMPTWNPGKQRGKAVPVRMSIPVHFKLK